MKVYGKCKNCFHELSCSTNVRTRLEFAMEEGEHKKLNCKNCGTDTEFHVDKLYAKTSLRALIVAGLVFLIGTPLLFFFMNFLWSHNPDEIYISGWFLLLPIMVYITMSKEEQNRVNSFNRRKFKARVHNIR